MGAVEGLLLVGPNGTRCCRYCLLIHDSLYKPGALGELRDPEDYRQTITKARELFSKGYGHTATAQQLLKAKGYKEDFVSHCSVVFVVTTLILYQSSLWPLQSARSTFFRKFSICSLHNLILGLIKKQLTFLGRMYGIDFRESMYFVVSVV